jgi:hypothetical protein
MSLSLHGVVSPIHFSPLPVCRSVTYICLTCTFLTSTCLTCKCVTYTCLTCTFLTYSCLACRSVTYTCPTSTCLTYTCLTCRCFTYNFLTNARTYFILQVSPADIPKVPFRLSDQEAHQLRSSVLCSLHLHSTNLLASPSHILSTLTHPIFVILVIIIHSTGKLVITV